MHIKCPHCGGEMVWRGYRPMFPVCEECDKVSHIDDCDRTR